MKNRNKKAFVNKLYFYRLYTFIILDSLDINFDIFKFYRLKSVNNVDPAFMYDIFIQYRKTVLDQR